MDDINGKHYPLWSQFVDRKQEWIGGVLEEQDESAWIPTIITDIELKSNGKDSAFFSVRGTKFICGFDVRVGGVTGGEKGWLTFSGYQGHTWRIKQRVESLAKDTSEEPQNA